MGYEIYLKKGEDKRVVNGHAWVYANEVQRIEGKDKNGSLASVFSYDGKFIGKGYINHLSKILVRIFIRDEQEEDTLDFYKERIKKANDYRVSIGYKNSYRMVFAEADLLPALIIDKYDNTFVIQSLSLGIEKNKEKIIKALIDLYNPKGIYERSDVQVRAKEGLEQYSGVIYGTVDDTIIIDENSIKMAVHVKTGQKTGYFLDQKENRFALRKYTNNKEVLDCFCNSGGFSMNAALNAKQVTAVDISQVALDNVVENATLNAFSNINTVCGDVFEILRQYKQEDKKFDVVILDPPAFCKSLAEVKDAYRGYKDINILGMKLVKKGGFLVSSSCSHYMTFPLFEKMLIDAAKESGRTVRTIELKSQALDHPSLLCEEETQYLKFFVLQVI